MHVKVLFFGILSDKTGTTSVTLEGINNMNELKRQLDVEYPTIEGQPYLVAVNQQITKDNVELAHGDEIALMPPFAGG